MSWKKKFVGNWGRLGMKYNLSDVCSRLSSGKNIRASEISSEGEYPVFGGNGQRGFTNHFNFDGECAIIGRQGAFCGNVRYFSGKAYMTEHAVVVCANDKSNIRYLAYLLSRMQLGRLSGQSAQPGLSVKVLAQQEIELPPVEYQNKIASILGSIEAKIFLNTEINNNLQQQAQAIFDNMFPNISNGSCTIGDYITPKRGKSLLSKNAIFGDVPVIAGGLEPSTYHNVANTRSPVLAISASGANAGYVSLWNIPIWSSDSSYIDSSMTDDVYFWYVLLKKRQKEIFDAQTGSAQPHIYPQHIASMSVSNLDIEEVHSYTSIVTPIFEIIGHHKEENTRLASLRDILLPKLMSGELDVSDIDL